MRRTWLWRGAPSQPCTVWLAPSEHFTGPASSLSVYFQSRVRCHRFLYFGHGYGGLICEQLHRERGRRLNTLSILLRVHNTLQRARRTMHNRNVITVSVMATWRGEFQLNNNIISYIEIYFRFFFLSCPSHEV